jgi:hypothetical protein
MKNTKKLFLAFTLFLLSSTIFNSCVPPGMVQPGNTKQDNTTPETPICKIKDKTDEFTKERSVASGPYQIYSQKIDLTKSVLSEYNYQENAATKSTQLDFYVYVRWENGKKKLGLVKYVYQVNYYLNFVYNGDPDSKIIFLLSNGDPLTLYADAIEMTELESDGWVTQRAVFKIDDSDWAKLRDNPPTKFRFRYSPGGTLSIYEKDIEIKEEYKGVIPFMLKCVDDLNLPK